jgi:hypothetical protein
VLPEGLVGCRTLFQEALRVGLVGRDVVAIVVVDLVVVPGDDPGMRGVRGLQVAIGFVLRLAVAILVEHRRPSALVAAHKIAAP